MSQVLGLQSQPRKSAARGGSAAPVIKLAATMPFSRQARRPGLQSLHDDSREYERGRHQLVRGYFEGDQHCHRWQRARASKAGQAATALRKFATSKPGEQILSYHPNRKVADYRQSERGEHARGVGPVQVRFYQANRKLSSMGFRSQVLAGASDDDQRRPGIGRQKTEPSVRSGADRGAAPAGWPVRFELPILGISPSIWG